MHVHDEWNAETGQDRHCSVDNPHYQCEITRPLAPDRHTNETEHVDNRSETHRQRAQEKRLRGMRDHDGEDIGIKKVSKD